LEVRGGRVRLGFDAPSDAPIHRLEVHEKIMRRPPAGAYAEAALAWPELQGASPCGMP
jgi:sRNA-binding carbon storage regulator CsrA